MLFCALFTTPLVIGGAMTYAMRPNVDLLKWQLDVAEFANNQELTLEERLKRANSIASSEYTMRNWGLFNTCQVIIPENSDLLFKNGTKQATFIGGYMKWRLPKE